MSVIPLSVTELLATMMDGAGDTIDGADDIRIRRLLAKAFPPEVVRDNLVDALLDDEKRAEFDLWCEAVALDIQIQAESSGIETYTNGTLPLGYYSEAVVSYFLQMVSYDPAEPE